MQMFFICYFLFNTFYHRFFERHDLHLEYGSKCCVNFRYYVHTTGRLLFADIIQDDLLFITFCSEQITKLKTDIKYSVI